MLIGVVEIYQGSIYKYELDKDVLFVDRVIDHTYPENYGYIPETLSPDGDPLDVFIIGPQPIYPHTKVKLKLIGYVEMLDNGIRDDKLICTVAGDTSIKKQELSQRIDNVMHFLQVYKKGVSVLNLHGLKQAEDLIEKSRKAFNKKGKK